MSRFSFIREKPVYPELPASVDVVVIGAGLAGAVSAFSAAGEGAAVIYLDLTEPGAAGYPAFSQAFWAAALYPAEAMAADIFSGGGQAGNYALISRFAEASAAALSWLEKQTGVQFAARDMAYPGLHVTSNPQELALLLPAITRDFDRMLYSHARGWKPVKIIVEGNRVLGLEFTDQDGNAAEVRTRAIVLADGGYAADPAMLESMTGVAHILPRREGGHKGAGLRLAMGAGARTNYLSALTFLPVFLPSQQKAQNFNPAEVLFLNAAGERIFASDSLAEMIWEANGRVFVLMDERNAVYGPDYQKAADAAELAVKLDVSPVVLAGSLDTLQPPYQFVEIGLMALMPGGLVINEQYAVLGREGPIEGLFAAGEITYGLHGPSTLINLVLADEIVSPLLAGYEAASWSLR